LSPDPVSWFVIEPGWEVVGSDGGKIGKVDEVVGDDTDDIFNGLAIVSGLFDKARYVPSELVGEIVDGRVQLKIPAGTAATLEEHEEPPASIQILPDQASVVERIEGSTIDRVHADEDRVSFWRKLRVWLAGRDR
jgi:Uncharacterized protein conserved in bacteria (DUF2171)